MHALEWFTNNNWYLFCLLRFASRLIFFRWAYLTVSAFADCLCRSTATKCRSMMAICCARRPTDSVDDASLDMQSYCSFIRECRQSKSSAWPAAVTAAQTQEHCHHHHHHHHMLVVRRLQLKQVIAQYKSHSYFLLTTEPIKTYKNYGNT